MTVWYNKILDTAHYKQCQAPSCQRCSTFREEALLDHQGPFDFDGPICGACSIWGVEQHAAWCR